MTTLLEGDPVRLAEAWLAVDPDAHTRSETEQILTAGGAAVDSRFTSRLSFGTAGLRGALGAGPQRMNRVLVRVVAAAVAARAEKEDPRPHMIVGFDARHGSRDFAYDTARVIAQRGGQVTIFPTVIPTPLLAFAVRHLDANAGVMVTASHNPKSDNGYKVYWQGGAQITSPVDAEISELIDAIPLLSDADLASVEDPAISDAGDDIAQAYIAAVVGLLDTETPRTARIAYTALHGVGASLFTRALDGAGFESPQMVANQLEPDPDFPTAPFPNPEEPGALDGLLDLAARTAADIALANDPDADRLAVAVPNGEAWRLLAGDELGCLLAEHLLSSNRVDEARKRLVINTVVSSRLLAPIARHHEARYIETLTGFKWIMQAAADHADHRLVLGYEEALGYSIGDVVSDKDGISAALAVAELASILKSDGRTLLDLLDEIHRRHGVHVTGQRSIRFESSDADPPVMTAAMESLRSNPPASLAGRPVRQSTDLADGTTDLPPTDGIVLAVDSGRVVVRPSGTEPKVKVYGEVFLEPSSDLGSDRGNARALLNRLLDDAVLATSSPEGRSSGKRGEQTATTSALGTGVPLTGTARASDLRLAVRCMDLTTLEGDDTPGRIRALCAQARRPDPADPTVGPVAAVCVYPALVAIAREVTAGGLAVASVAGAFPSRLSSLEVRLADIRHAVESGADEVDIVLNRSAFLSGDLSTAADELRASREAAEPVLLKVILGVGELGTADQIRLAAQMAIDCGADFIKTSTGKAKTNATPDAVLALAQAVADHHASTGVAVGLKIAGGVRTADDALGYMALVRSILGDSWLNPERFRFGASSLLNEVLADLTATEGNLR